MKNSAISQIFNAIDDGKCEICEFSKEIANEQELLGSLPSEVRKTVNKLLDNAINSCADENEAYFAMGFKLGIKLGLELL